MLTLQELETALDTNRLECQWQNSKWYAVRRNGATKRWKRDPSRFILPCKTGYRECFSIGTQMDAVAHHLDSPYLRIKE